MKHAYCVHKLFEFNNRNFLFIKNIKNLHGEEKYTETVQLDGRQAKFII